MALSIAQQPTLPLHFPLQIIVRRMTVAGMQYSILDRNHEQYTAIEVVTLANGVTTCTCGQSGECEHIQVALEKEEAYKAEAVRRESFVETFGIYR